MINMRKTPSEFFATWIYCFVDEECLSIPHLSESEYMCKFTKKGEFYESSIKMNYVDISCQKNNKLNYGLTSYFFVNFYPNFVKYSVDFIIANTLSYSVLTERCKDGVIDVDGYVIHDNFETYPVRIQYTYEIAKRERILSGYRIKIPVSYVEKYFEYMHKRMMQNIKFVYNTRCQFDINNILLALIIILLCIVLLCFIAK